MITKHLISHHNYYQTKIYFICWYFVDIFITKLHRWKLLFLFSFQIFNSSARLYCNKWKMFCVNKSRKSLEHILWHHINVNCLHIQDILFRMKKKDLYEKIIIFDRMLLCIYGDRKLITNNSPESCLGGQGMIESGKKSNCSVRRTKIKKNKNESNHISL